MHSDKAEEEVERDKEEEELESDKEEEEEKSDKEEEEEKSDKEEEELESDKKEEELESDKKEEEEKSDKEEEEEKSDKEEEELESEKKMNVDEDKDKEEEEEESEVVTPHSPSERSARFWANQVDSLFQEVSLRLKAIEENRATLNTKKRFCAEKREHFEKKMKIEEDSLMLDFEHINAEEKILLRRKKHLQEKFCC